MSLVEPNIQDSPSFDAMAVPDATDDWCLLGAIAGTGVVSGVAVTQDTGSDMKVAYSGGQVAVAGTLYTVTSGTATVSAASTSDRRDVVVYRAGTGVVVLAGTPCGTVGWTRSAAVASLPPVKPAVVRSTDCVLAEVYVTPTTVAIVTAVNLRALGVQPMVIALTSANETALRQAASPDQLLTMQGPLSFGGFKATNLANGTSAQDAAAFGQLPFAVSAAASNQTGDADVSLPATTNETVGTTGSLAALGTYIIIAKFTILNSGATAGICSLKIANGTGSILLGTGAQADEKTLPASGYADLMVVCGIAVGGAGTLIFQAQSSVAATCKRSGSVLTGVSMGGFAAFRVA